MSHNLSHSSETDSKRARAFTTIEVLVAVALLAVTIVAVTEVFDISSEATGRTTAHAEVMAASAAVQQRLSDLLSKIEPGLLIIESPAPTGARADIPGAPEYFRLRHDRLVFIASGSPGEFQSCTDPTCGTPDDPLKGPAGSSQALVYFGPGIPLGNAAPIQPRPFDHEGYSLAASEWIFAHRAILFVLDPPAAPVPDWGENGRPPDMGIFADAGGMLDDDELHDEYKECQMDVVVSDLDGDVRADAATFVKLFGDLDDDYLLSNDPRIHALWEPNYCPTTVKLDDPDVLDYYMRSGFNFQPHLADFRIEWTDGRSIDPTEGDFRTRWFGLRPDPAQSPNLNNPDSIDYLPVLRQDPPYGVTTPAEAEAFGITGAPPVNHIEWATHTGGDSDPDAAYRAVWRADTWQFRPKALRFTYRVYDANNRLQHTAEIDLDEDGDFDPDDPSGQPDRSRYAVTRYGKEFSIVVPIP